MSQDQTPFTRARDPSIDFMKLQLLMAVNQLRLEIITHSHQHKQSLDKFWEVLENKKKLDNSVTFEVVSINDRLNFILELARNMLRNPIDPENKDYHDFEQLAKTILGIKLQKKKLFGLKKKSL